MTSLRDRIKTEAVSGGFRLHPLGTFNAIVEDVVKREWDGNDIFEIQLRSDEGKCKTSIWRTSVNDIEGKFMKMAQGDRSKAELIYVQTMGRLLRLYTDLGLDEPDGENETAIEDFAFSHLGDLRGRPCTIVVHEDKKNPTQNRKVFINAPESGASVTATPRTAFENMTPPDMTNIPF